MSFRLGFSNLSTTLLPAKTLLIFQAAWNPWIKILHRIIKMNGLNIWRPIIGRHFWFKAFERPSRVPSPLPVPEIVLYQNITKINAFWSQLFYVALFSLPSFPCPSPYFLSPSFTLPSLYRFSPSDFLSSLSPFFHFTLWNKSKLFELIAAAEVRRVQQFAKINSIK